MSKYVNIYYVSTEGIHSGRADKKDLNLGLREIRITYNVKPLTGKHTHRGLGVNVTSHYVCGKFVHSDVKAAITSRIEELADRRARLGKLIADTQQTVERETAEQSHLEALLAEKIKQMNQVPE